MSDTGIAGSWPGIAENHSINSGEIWGRELSRWRTKVMLDLFLWWMPLQIRLLEETQPQYVL